MAKATSPPRKRTAKKSAKQSTQALPVSDDVEKGLEKVFATWDGLLRVIRDVTQRVLDGKVSGSEASRIFRITGTHPPVGLDQREFADIAKALTIEEQKFLYLKYLRIAAVTNYVFVQDYWARQRAKKKKKRKSNE